MGTVTSRCSQASSRPASPQKARDEEQAFLDSSDFADHLIIRQPSSSSSSAARFWGCQERPCCGGSANDEVFDFLDAQPVLQAEDPPLYIDVIYDLDGLPAGAASLKPLAPSVPASPKLCLLRQQPLIVPKARRRSPKVRARPKAKRKREPRMLSSGSNDDGQDSRQFSSGDVTPRGLAERRPSDSNLAEASAAMTLALAEQELRRLPKLEEMIPNFEEAALLTWEPMSGWLMKKKGAVYRPMGLARATAGTMVDSLFWNHRHFKLGSEYLTYGNASGTDEESSALCGGFALAEIDGIAARGKDCIVHFGSLQRTGKRRRARDSICLRAESAEQAERWGRNIRVAAAARLRGKLPREWDVTAMLREEKKATEGKNENTQVRLVSEVPLPQASVLAVQRLMDHSFICKRTRDRGEQETPVQLEVMEVIRVQNSAAWIKYNKARAGVKSGSEKLIPDVRTATHDDRLVSAVLGELDETSNEQWLFHGTSSAGVEGITHRDFRLDLAGTHRGTMYGKGVYLAECSSKADEYAYEEQDGLCRMLLCRAVLGRMLVDIEAKPKADELMKRYKQGYDSLCGDRWTAVGTFREFVLYNQSQIYPAFIVLYRRISQAQLLQGIGEAADRYDLPTACRLITYAALLAETHPDPVVRYRISMLLAARTLLVVPVLTQSLQDERKVVRTTAAAALGKLGAHTTPSVAGPAESNDVCRAVAQSAVPILSESLKDDSPEVRQACAVALQRFGLHSKRAVPNLTEILKDSDASVKEEAARCLGQLGFSATSAMPALAILLKDDAAGVRQVAATALGCLCTASPSARNTAVAVGALAEHLSDEVTDVRLAVATALGKVGPAQATPTVLEGLQGCLEDTTDAVRQASCTALGHFGAKASAALQQLVDRLHDESGGVRAAAAVALGCLGTESSKAVQALKHALKDSDKSVCTAASLSLGQIAAQPGGPGQVLTAVHALARCLKDTDVDIRVSAAVALGFFGPSISSALSSLTERIKDSSPEVRKAAAIALTTLGEHAAPALPALMELSNDSNEDARKRAQAVVSEIQRRLESLGQEAELEAADPSQNYHFLSYYKFTRKQNSLGPLVSAEQIPELEYHGTDDEDEGADGTS